MKIKKIINRTKNILTQTDLNETTGTNLKGF